MSGKSRREAMREHHEAHDAKAVSFTRMMEDLRILSWRSPLSPKVFDASVDLVIGHAASAFGVPLGDPVVPAPVPPDEVKPVEPPSSTFESLISTASFELAAEGREQIKMTLGSMRWEEMPTRHISTIIGARMPEDFVYRHAHETTRLKLRGGKEVVVEIFFDWYSTSPFALRAQVFVCNALPNQGWTDFGDIIFRVRTGASVHEASALEEHGTVNTIRPRGVLPLHVDTQPGMWSGLPTPQKSPSWTNEILAKYDNDLTDQHVGPYRISFPYYKSLGEGSKGGWGIPYHGGGARCWTAGDPLAYYVREHEWLGIVGRSPIVAYNEDGSVFRPTTPYWLGDSVQMFELGNNHVPTEYCYTIDGLNGSRSSYAPELYSYQPPEFSHQWRMVRAAAQLAPFCAGARWWLIQCWNECLRWLLGNEAGDASSNDLFWSWKQRVLGTPHAHGASWAGRGLAHVIATLGEVYPYVPEGEQWVDEIVDGLTKIQMRSGSVLAALEWDKCTVSQGGTIPDDALRAAAREEQLLVCALRKLQRWSNSPELSTLTGRLAASIGMNPAEVYTVNALGDPRFMQIEYVQEYYNGYSHMTMLEWSEYPDAEECLAAAQHRPFQENPLDYTPRSMWASDV